MLRTIERSIGRRIGRNILRIRSLAAVVLAAASMAAGAAGWPDHPIRMVVPSAAGSPPDVMARLIAQRLGARWSQQVIVDNKPGASGIIGMNAVTHAPADGYTFILTHAATIAVTPRVNASARYDIDADFAAVAMVAAGPLVIVADTRHGAASLPAFIAQAKQAGGPVNVGVNGQYSLPHLAAESFRRSTGLDLNIVSFSSSGTALTAVMNGDVQLLFDGLPGVEGMLKGGRIKALAVTSKSRVALAPGVPALSETLPGQDVNGWFVLLARKGTPADIIERVNRDLNAVVADKSVVEQMANVGVQPRPMSVAEVGHFVNAERARWASLLTGMNIRKQP